MVDRLASSAVFSLRSDTDAWEGKEKVGYAGIKCMGVTRTRKVLALCSNVTLAGYGGSHLS